MLRESHIETALKNRPSGNPISGFRAGPVALWACNATEHTTEANMTCNPKPEWTAEIVATGDAPAEMTDAGWTVVTRMTPAPCGVDCCGYETSTSASKDGKTFLLSPDGDWDEV
jgi:hypothetical protein